MYKQTATECGDSNRISSPTPWQVLAHAEHISKQKLLLQSQRKLSKDLEEERIRRMNYLEAEKKRKENEAIREAARLDAEAKSNEPGPLIKTLFQKDTIRRVMAHAMHIMEQSKAGKC